MYIKVLCNIKNNKKNPGGGGGGAAKHYDSKNMSEKIKIFRRELF